MILFFILILFLSITFHEYAHGWTANRLGDSTAKNAGRLTLNPLAHIDIFGTLILPILLLIASKGAFAIGYAKPVPVNPHYFKNPKKDMLWVGLSGPAVNLIIALLLALLWRLNISPLSNILIAGIFVNLLLFLFNLIPIPPLDGSKILAALLPAKVSYKYLRMERYGYILVFLLVVTGFLRTFILPTVLMIIYFLLGVRLPL